MELYINKNYAYSMMHPCIYIYVATSSMVLYEVHVTKWKHQMKFQMNALYTYICIVFVYSNGYPTIIIRSYVLSIN